MCRVKRSLVMMKLQSSETFYISFGSLLQFSGQCAVLFNVITDICIYTAHLKAWELAQRAFQWRLINNANIQDVTGRNNRSKKNAIKAVNHNQGNKYRS